jgi:hypothetical protein
MCTFWIFRTSFQRECLFVYKHTLIHTHIYTDTTAPQLGLGLFWHHRRSCVSGCHAPHDGALEST